MSAPDRVALSVHIEEAADAEDEWAFGVPYAGEWELESAYFCADAAVTADDTNYATIKLLNGSTTLATMSFTTSGTGNVAQYDMVAFSLSNAGGNPYTGGTDAIRVEKDDPGTGMALHGSVVLGLRAVRR